MKAYSDLIKVKLVFVCQNWVNHGIINIGFLEIAKFFPNDYEQINFVFHDVDNLPYTHLKQREYPSLFSTTEGVMIQDCLSCTDGQTTVGLERAEALLGMETLPLTLEVFVRGLV